MTKLTALGVFCGGSNGNDPDFLKAGKELGKELGKKGIDLVFGYSFNGIMGAVATQAKKNGGRIVGVVTPHLRKFETPNFDLDELMVVSSMHIRKDIMFNRSDAYCFLPGGIGTLDEFFEILTMKQIGEINKPIILVNIDGFWDHLVGLIDETIRHGFAKEHHRKIFTVVSKVKDVIPVIEEELRSNPKYE